MFGDGHSAFTTSHMASLPSLFRQPSTEMVSAL